MASDELDDGDKEVIRPHSMNPKITVQTLIDLASTYVVEETLIVSPYIFTLCRFCHLRLRKGKLRSFSVLTRIFMGFLGSITEAFFFIQNSFLDDDDELKEGIKHIQAIFSEHQEIKEEFTTYIIRKIVFGGKISQPVHFEVFKSRMERFDNLLLSPELIRQELMFFIGRKDPKIFDDNALKGLGSEVTSYRSARQSIVS